MQDMIHSVRSIEHPMPVGGPLLLRIRHLLAWQFNVDVEAIEAETHLVERLYADSLDLLETAHLLNREFDIEIAPEQLAAMRTVGAIERIVAAALRATATPAAADG